MIYGLKKIARYALGTDIAGRGVAVRPDDTFVVSYPRSGSTWTRFLIANLLHPDEDVTFANIERLIPDAEAQSSRYMKRVPGPRVIKSHQYFDHRYPRVIYIVRDPRDVVLSYYDFSRKYRYIPDEFPLSAYAGNFTRGRLASAEWGTWAENVTTWLAARERHPNFTLLRYEDLVADTEVEMARLAKFFAIDADPERLTRAVQRSSADRMRGFEKTQENEWVSTKGRRTDIPFVGTAVPGKWKLQLPAEAVVEIEAAWSSLMSYLGYELVTK
jgi:hypothetical protein